MSVWSEKKKEETKNIHTHSHIHTPTSNQLSRLKTAEIVIIRYYDHVLFRDITETSPIKPVIREAIGWLYAEESDFVRLIWERYAEPVIDEQSRTRVTGLVIRKCDIVEAVKIG